MEAAARHDQLSADGAFVQEPFYIQHGSFLIVPSEGGVWR
jgi:hypothetical protein